MKLSNLFMPLLLVSLLLYGTVLFGASPYNNGAANILEGANKISNYIIFDTYKPLSYYSEGDIEIYVNPYWADVSKLYGHRSLLSNDNAKRNDDSDLTGYGLSSGVSYAFFNWFAVFGIYTYSYLKGNVDATYSRRFKRPYDKPDNYGYVTNAHFITHSKGWAKSDTYIFGVNFEPLGAFRKGSVLTLSVVVTLGILKRESEYDIKAVFHDSLIEYENRPSRSLEPNWRIKGSADHWGYYFNAGIGNIFDVMDQRFKATVYMLLFGARDPDVRMISESGTREKYETQPTGGSFLGLSLIYMATGNLSFGISLSGFVNNFTNYYNDYFFDGLEMKNVSVSAIYRISTKK